MSRKMFIKVRGTKEEWVLDIYGNLENLETWREDGLEVFVVENECPKWVLDAKIHKPWFWLQDLFHFKWLRKDK